MHITIIYISLFKTGTGEKIKHFLPMIYYYTLEINITLLEQKFSVDD